MIIKIIETWKQGKVNEELCEDALFISDQLIAVIDGVTSKSDFRYEGKTTGKLASEIVSRVLKGLCGREALQEIVDRINEEIALFYEQVKFPYDKREKGLQAACVIYSAYYREIWMIGDCQSAVDGTVFLNPKKSDVILSEMRSLILSIMESERAGKVKLVFNEQDEARGFILPWILRSTIFANDDRTPYGYSVFNGQRIPKTLIKVLSLDDRPHEVVLASDGYPELKNTLEETEGRLKEILKGDPNCYKDYLSTKGLARGQESFDDRTYVRFLV